MRWGDFLDYLHRPNAITRVLMKGRHEGQSKRRKCDGRSRDQPRWPLEVEKHKEGRGRGGDSQAEECDRGQCSHKGSQGARKQCVQRAPLSTYFWRMRRSSRAHPLNCDHLLWQHVSRSDELALGKEGSFSVFSKTPRLPTIESSPAFTRQPWAPRRKWGV